jgi:hypothetical protein
MSSDLLAILCARGVPAALSRIAEIVALPLRVINKKLEPNTPILVLISHGDPRCALPEMCNLLHRNGKIIP